MILRSFAEGVMIELFTFCSPDLNSMFAVGSTSFFVCTELRNIAVSSSCMCLTRLGVLDFCFQLQRALIGMC
jgi:hypothetical protein